MALTIVFMALFSILLAIRNLKSKYNLLFIVMVLGMSLSLLTIISEVYKGSNYHIPSIISYRGIEYRMFLYISRIFTLSLSNLQILRNFGIMLYLTANMSFAITFNKNINVEINKKGVRKIRKAFIYAFLIAYPILYFLFYNPNTAYNIFLLSNKLDGIQKTLFVNITIIIDYLMLFSTLVYLIYPIYILFRSFIKSKISFLAEQLLALTISLFLLNSIFFMVFFTGAFKTSIHNVLDSAFWRYELDIIVPGYYISVLPIFSFVILLIILFITYKFKTDRMISGIKERTIKKNLDLLNTNLKDVLHSDKNIMFNIKILSQETLDNYGTELGKQKLNRILTISENHMESISKTLDSIRELRVRTIRSNIIDAIENAIKEVTIPETINLTKSYKDHPLYCNFDMYHMTQVIANLITNAIDAINCGSNKDAYIKITVDTSNEWIYISIKDNGIGISKKNQKKIFTPYFSTKSKQSNWGMGLSYAFRVITSHYGYLRIKSKPGEYTNVEILLPMAK